MRALSLPRAALFGDSILLMRSLRSLTALSGVLAIGTAISAAPAAAKSNEAACADTIFHGGSIITMQGDTPETVEALAVSGATILAQGDLQDLAANQCEDTQDRDLAGKTLLPGFIDAHGHVSAVGQLAVMANLSAPPVGDATSIEAIQDRLRAYIADNALPAGTLLASAAIMISEPQRRSSSCSRPTALAS